MLGTRAGRSPIGEDAARGDEALLRVEDLRVELPTEDGPVLAVDGISFEVRRGQTLGIVGESGSGKTVSALSVMGLTRAQGARVSGHILFEGVDLLTLPEERMRALRGNELAMIFQDPLSALHPLLRVGAQVVEAIRAHREVSRRAAREQAIGLLELVGIPEPARRVDAYPHELSGGMRQRATIAMALANEPKLLIADEPTTALDVTVQAQILALLRRLRQELGMALLLVTHDLGVVAEMAEEIAVMHAGRIVERGSAERVLTSPEHPYTQGLLRSMPTLERPREPEPAVPEPTVAEPTVPEPAASEPTVPEPAASESAVPEPAVPDPLLEVRDLVKRFPIARGVVFQRHLDAVEAVAGISFELRSGETLGLVGETGCGKSTTARLIMRLLEPTGGEIRFQGHDIAHLKGAALKAARREMQIVFQDPYSSLNPRKTAGSIIGEPFAIHGLHADRAERRRAVCELMDRVGLQPEHHNRYPHEFSGGQRQRIGVARALALRPKLLIADEPVSALDVTIQAQILDLLRELQRELGLTLLLISHDLAVVRQMADRVAVMRHGKIVELAAGETLYGSPQHPYTRELLASVPGAHRDRRTIPG
ncbi:MAG: dipeptide ABC transporter ATP-binding protein [Solirubrobacterales bacterium]